MKLNLLLKLSLGLLFAFSMALAHEGASSGSIWESQMVAYAVATAVGGISYFIMVFETPAEKRRKLEQRR